MRRFDTTDDAGNAKFQFGRIEEGVYVVRFVGATASGRFQLDGSIIVERCANPDATYAGGRHPIDLAIKTQASGISSGVRGAMYFFTNSSLTSYVGGAAHLVNARVNGSRVEADAASGRVVIDVDPGTALAIPLNVATLNSGLIAAGKQITGGRVELQFEHHGRVGGALRFETPYGVLEAVLRGTALSVLDKTGRQQWWW